MVYIHESRLVNTRTPPGRTPTARAAALERIARRARGPIAMASFVNRLVNYVVNELAVNALANSKTFQRFAVRSDALMREATREATSGEAAALVKSAAERAKRAAEDAAKEFMKQQKSGGTGGGGV